MEAGREEKYIIHGSSCFCIALSSRLLALHGGGPASTTSGTLRRTGMRKHSLQTMLHRLQPVINLQTKWPR
eukprot:2365394-Pleurochrysis_carterae.AAC.1